MHSKRHAAVSFTLFPFLSVMVAFLGVLLFLAAAISPSSVENAQEDYVLSIPRVSPHGKTPILIDCDSEVGRVYGQSVMFTKQNEEEQFEFGTWDRTPFQRFLNSLEEKSDEEYILFLVRPNGIQLYRQLLVNIVLRNREFGVATVELPNPLAEDQLSHLPSALRQRLAQHDNQISIQRRMTDMDRAALITIANDPVMRSAVQTLYQRSQHLSWIDYGKELVTQEYTVRFEEKPPAERTR